MQIAGHGNDWVKVPVIKSKARLRLICLPHAGGGASVFSAWARAIPPEVELCAVQMPGREERLNEAPFSGWEGLVERLAEALRPYMTLPFALLGHSLGATLAFELACHLRRSRLECRHLFVCGRRAPHMPLEEPATYKLPQSRFVEELRRLACTPEEVLGDTELLEVFLPLLRADFQLSETYVYHQSEPLNMPISAYGGVEDERVPAENLERWRDYSSISFRSVMFPGGHFFLHQHPGAVLSEISRELQRLLAA